MLKPSADIDIFIASEPVDMRKAIDGLSVLVVEMLSAHPQSGGLFIFYNKQRNKVKCLCWDTNGFALYYKRLERGKFKVPRAMSEGLTVDNEQLQWLLAGFDFIGLKSRPDLVFSHFA